MIFGWSLKAAMVFVTSFKNHSGCSPLIDPAPTFPFSSPPPLSSAPSDIPQGLIDWRPSRAQWLCTGGILQWGLLFGCTSLRWVLWTTYCGEPTWSGDHGTVQLRDWGFTHISASLPCYSNLSFLDTASPWSIRRPPCQNLEGEIKKKKSATEKTWFKRSNFPTYSVSNLSALLQPPSSNSVYLYLVWINAPSSCVNNYSTGL